MTNKKLFGTISIIIILFIIFIIVFKKNDTFANYNEYKKLTNSCNNSDGNIKSVPLLNHRKTLNQTINDNFVKTKDEFIEECSNRHNCKYATFKRDINQNLYPYLLKKKHPNVEFIPNETCNGTKNNPEYVTYQKKDKYYLHNHKHPHQHDHHKDGHDHYHHIGSNHHHPKPLPINMTDINTNISNNNFIRQHSSINHSDGNCMFTPLPDQGINCNNNITQPNEEFIKECSDNTDCKGFTVKLNKSGRYYPGCKLGNPRFSNIHELEASGQNFIPFQPNISDTLRIDDNGKVFPVGFELPINEQRACFIKKDWLDNPTAILSWLDSITEQELLNPSVLLKIEEPPKKIQVWSNIHRIWDELINEIEPFSVNYNNISRKILIDIRNMNGEELLSFLNSLSKPAYYHQSVSSSNTYNLVKKPLGLTPIEYILYIFSLHLIKFNVENNNEREFPNHIYQPLKSLIIVLAILHIRLKNIETEHPSNLNHCKFPYLKYNCIYNTLNDVQEQDAIKNYFNDILCSDNKFNKLKNNYIDLIKDFDIELYVEDELTQAFDNFIIEYDNIWNNYIDDRITETQANQETEPLEESYLERIDTLEQLRQDIETKFNELKNSINNSIGNILFNDRQYSCPPIPTTSSSIATTSSSIPTTSSSIATTSNSNNNDAQSAPS